MKDHHEKDVPAHFLYVLERKTYFREVFMNNHVTIGVVYTSTTPELIENVNSELRKAVGEEAGILEYQDPSILAEVREHGYVTPGAAARLVTMFMKAVSDGADVILNCCSSVGEAADAAQDIGRYTGIPIVRIDEEMCRAAVREAARTGGRIGVLATLATTLTPTKNTVLRCAREINRQVILVDGLIDGAFGIDQEQFKEMLCAKTEEIKDQVDVILLCQGSMAYAQDAIHDRFGMPVFASPGYGAAAVREALKAKGLI